VLEAGGSRLTSEEAVQAWEAGHRVPLERCLAVIADIQSSHIYDTTTLPVALRELRNVVRVGSAPSIPADAVAAEPITFAG